MTKAGRVIHWLVERSRAKDTYVGDRVRIVADPPPPTTWASPGVDIRRQTNLDGSTGWAVADPTGYIDEAPAVRAAHRAPGPSHILGDRWMGHPTGGVAGPTPYRFRYEIIRDDLYPGQSQAGGLVVNPNPPPGFKS